MKIDQWGLRMFHAVVNVDNGMERFQWSGYILAKDRESAVKHIEKKYRNDLIRLIEIYEIEPRDGMIFS